MSGSAVGYKLGAFSLVFVIPAVSFAEDKCPDLNASWSQYANAEYMDGWIIPLQGSSASRNITRSDMSKTINNLIVRNNPPRFTCDISSKSGTCIDHRLNRSYYMHPRIGGANSSLREEYYMYALDSNANYFLTSIQDSVDKRIVSCRNRTLTVYTLGRMYTKTDNNRVYSDNVVAPYLRMTKKVSPIRVTPYTPMPSF